MGREIKVSVIILSYYHEQYIKTAIESVLEQKCNFDYEIIIADDFSQDGTLNIVEMYRSKLMDKMKIVPHDKNVGTTKNLYDAYMQCKGEYIVQLSGDDRYIDVNKLQKQVDFLDSYVNKDFIAVGTTIKQVYSDGSESGLIVPNDDFRGKEFTKELFLSGLMFRNIFIDEKTSDLAKKQFKKMYDFSKYVEDLTLNFFLYDYGRIFILYDITYAVLTRRSTDLNQHNYNSIRKREQMIADHLFLLKELQNYYGMKVNMQKRFEGYINQCLKIAFLNRNFGTLQLLRGVPVKYIVPSVILGASRIIIKLIKGRGK